MLQGCHTEETHAWLRRVGISSWCVCVCVCVCACVEVCCFVVTFKKLIKKTKPSPCQEEGRVEAKGKHGKKKIQVVFLQTQTLMCHYVK